MIVERPYGGRDRQRQRRRVRAGRGQEDRPGQVTAYYLDPIHNTYRVLGEKVGNAFRDGAKLK